MAATPSALQQTLETRRQTAEQCGAVFESTPLDSSADASHFVGVEFDRKVPTAGEWLKQRSIETEEDTVVDAIDDVLKTRGPRPAHAPAPANSDDEDRISALANSLMELQRQKLQEKGQLEDERARVNALEEKVCALEAELSREKEEKLQREEDSRNYPRPTWLPECRGTINVAISGNSGVGKSLLINRIRRLKRGAAEWAETGVKETTMRPTMYTFPGRDTFRLWDLPGAGTENFPQEEYIKTMGLRYFDSVLIVSATRFTTTEVELRRELDTYGVPNVIVRTKIDIDVWNNQIDNRVNEEATLMSIREDLKQQHGVSRSYLVSSRDPEMYDMPQLLREIFPGWSKALDANAPCFEPGGAGGGAWSLLPDAPPEPSLSQLLSGIQGRWTDAYDGTAFEVHASQVHITLEDDRKAIMNLTENDRGVWWNNRWSVDMASVATAKNTQELRWTPADLRNKPLIWRWAG